jgi:hypothetical protein
VSIRTNKYLYPYLPGFTSVKSTSQLRPGALPRTRVPVCRSPFFAGFHSLAPSTLVHNLLNLGCLMREPEAGQLEEGEQFLLA